MEDTQNPSKINNLNKMCSSRKDIILDRSLTETSNNNASLNAFNDEVKCDTIQIYDDDDDDVKNESEFILLKYPQPLLNVSSEYRRCQNDDEILRRLDQEIHKVNKNIISSDSANKRKMNNLVETNTKQMEKEFVHKKQNKNIEIVSVLSSNNTNVRILLESESSSELIISRSSQHTEPYRPTRLKNTLLVDNFDRCLADLSKKYPEMNYKERISLWNYSTDVSDIEDDKPIINSQRILQRKRKSTSLSSQEPFKKIQIVNRYSSNKGSSTSNLKTNNDINCNKASSNQLKEKNKHLTPKSSNCNNSNASESKSSRISNLCERDNNLNDENVLMSINKKSKKISKNDHKMMSTNRNSRRNNNLDIDKMRIIQTRANYKQNITENKVPAPEIIKYNNINNKEQFRVPSIPLKNLLSSVTSNNSISNPDISSAVTTSGKKVDETTQEEFYKYLGLGSKSPNGKCNEINSVGDSNGRDKISLGRVTRLQREKITKLMKNDSIKIDSHHNSHCKNFNKDQIFNKKTIENGSHVKMKNNKKWKYSKKLNSTKTDPKIKIINQEFLPSLTSLKQQEYQKRNSEPRRNCGCIVNTGVTNKLIGSLLQKNHMNQTFSKISTASSISTEDPTKEIKILTRHVCRDQITKKLNSNDGTKNSNFTTDLSSTMPKTDLKQGQIGLTKLTLLDESKINPIAKKLYEKFTKMLEEIKSRKDNIFIEIKDFKEVKQNGNIDKENFQSNILSESTSKIFIKDDLQNVQLDNDDASNSLNLTQNQSRLLLKSVSADTNFVPSTSNIEDPSCSYSPALNANDLKKKFHNKFEEKIMKNAQRKLKFYQRIIKNKDFLRFLAKRNLNITKKIHKSTLKNKVNNSILKEICLNQTENEPKIEEKIIKNNNAKDSRLEQDEIQQKTDSNMCNLNEKEAKQSENNEIMNCEPLLQPSSSSSTSLKNQNLLENPLNSSYGDVLHIYYDYKLLIVVQERLVSFWNYSKVNQMMCKTQAWIQVGQCTRNLYDSEVQTLYKNRLCANDTNPLYIEMRAKEYPSDGNRECNMSSVYVNVYYYSECNTSGKMCSIQLDTIKGLANSICYTSITNSRYFIMCWRQEGILDTSYTGICKYSLTPDLNTLASIREFYTMKHIINYIECISEDKMIGFGETQITIWDHHNGDILININLETPLGINLGSVLTCFNFENYLFLYQLYNNSSSCISNSNKNNNNNNNNSKDCDDNKILINENQNINSNSIKMNINNINNEHKPPELRIIGITLANHPQKFHLIHIHQLPLSFKNIKSSICNGNYLIATSAINDDELLLIPNEPNNIYFMRHKNKMNQYKNDQQTSSGISLKICNSTTNMNDNYNNADNKNSIIKHFYTNLNENFIEITNDTLMVKSIHNYLLNFTT